MKIINLTNKKGGTYKFDNIAFNLQTPNNSKFDSLGQIQRIILHTTAGHRTTLYDDYHYNITQIENEVYVFQVLRTDQKGQHLWGRNSNCLAISLNCLYDSDPPTEYMLDTMSLLVAELSAWKNIGIHDMISLPAKTQITDSDGREILVNTGYEIKMPKVADHAMYAHKDGYYPDRVDIEKYFKKVIDKADKYYKELKDPKSKRKFTFIDIIK